MPALVFIDTNIFLDFYRYGNDVSLSLLDRVNDNHDRIITTAEVEMEYKKNRQKVILTALSAIKPQNSGQLNVPAFLKESQHKQTSIRIQKQLNTLGNRLVARTEKLLESPSRNDPVYQILQRLFKSKKDCHLNRGKKMRSEIREKAYKRFLLGYPPRKPNDTSIGDAINWEWIIYCAKNRPGDIVIISRDTDYGEHHKDRSFLNDWLYQEFKERVSHRRSIMLTRRLSEGFKLAEITVSLEEEQAEESFLSTYKFTYSDILLSSDALRSAMSNISGIYDADALRSVISEITLNSDALRTTLGNLGITESNKAQQEDESSDNNSDKSSK